MVDAQYCITEGTNVVCNLCPHHCVLKNNVLSRCHSRLLVNGKPKSIAYKDLCALATDPVEKKPLFHIKPSTSTLSVAIAGCNLHCKQCQNASISACSSRQVGVVASLEPGELVKLAISQGVSSISLTYTEPLVFYEYTKDVAMEARQKGLNVILVTAGYVNKEPLKALLPFVSAINVDLKAFDDGVYKKLTGGSLNPVLQTLKLCLEYGVWLEITNLLIPGYNTSTQMITGMCHWLVDNGFERVPLHFSRFYPSYKLMDVPKTPREIMNQAYKIAIASGIKYVYLGNVISDFCNTYCPVCGKLLIQRNGYVVNNYLDGNKCGHCANTIDGRF